MPNTTKRRIAVAVTAVFLFLGLVGGVLWYRCGLRGCPDVDMLKGYMPDEASVLLDRDGEEIDKLFVERRTVVPVDSLPEHVLNAFVAVEDKRFWTHSGVDWRRVFGALLTNVKAGNLEEGSSTITMQLARNVFPDQLPAHKKTIWRKLGEARVAREIESRYSKRDILELYLNQIYFGSGAYGIESAAQEYFAKPSTKLTLAEGALLAALPRAPSRLNPRANEDAALEGRTMVLGRMAAQGMITEEERAEAADARLRVRQGRRKVSDAAPYFVELVRQQLEAELGNALYTEGYTIHTTLDLSAQRVAEQEFSQHLAAIESGRYGTYIHATRASFNADSVDPEKGTPYLQGALLIMQAQTGDVLALIGGRDFAQSEFNRATQAERQPGSAFKPFVYAAAIAAGFTPTHRLIDRPLRYVLDNGRVWEPANYEGRYAGAVSMREALTYSKNVATVRLANEVGISRVLDMAEQMGLGRLQAHPSVVLGTAEVTPLRLTSAYAAFATLGQRPEPRFVTRVVDRAGMTVWAQQPDVRRVIDPATAFLTTSFMEDVVSRGTGTGVRAGGFRGAAAGKTGTTQDASDVWFIGFTPEIVGTIWIGLDRRKRILSGATGGELAAPLWGRIMARARLGGGSWSPPGGIEQRTVDEMGVAISAGCTQAGVTRTEYFLSGTAPMENCYTDYAMLDTLGYYNGYYDSVVDTLTSANNATDDEAWWRRFRARLLGRDTLRGVPPDSQVVTPVPVTPPGTVPVPTDTTRPVLTPPGRPPSDTTRPVPTPSARPPLGTPVPIRPRPDTTRT